MEPVCPCHSTTKQEDWEEGFYDLYSQLPLDYIGTGSGRGADREAKEDLDKIVAFIASEITKKQIEVLEEVEREAEAAREIHVISVGLERLIKGILRTVRIRIINGQQQKVSSPKD